jgi:hypothetical protein
MNRLRVLAVCAQCTRVCSGHTTQTYFGELARHLTLNVFTINALS